MCLLIALRLRRLRWLFDNSAIHSLFPDAELAIVRMPPDRASPVEIAEHQARMRELIEHGIEIGGKRYNLVVATGACKHGDFLFAHTPLIITSMALPS